MKKFKAHLVRHDVSVMNADVLIAAPDHATALEGAILWADDADNENEWYETDSRNGVPGVQSCVEDNTPDHVPAPPLTVEDMRRDLRGFYEEIADTYGSDHTLATRARALLAHFD